jgi:hypothetical protein
MSIFDFLFILLFVASVVTLLTVAVLALRGKRVRAAAILRRYGICFGVYMVIVFAVAFLSPRRVFNIGEERCFDDWCVAVESYDHAPTAEGVLYHVTLRLSSRARRISQRAKGAYVYLTDAQGRRFDPIVDPSATPMDVLLHPGEAVETKRSFTLPADAREVGVVVVHEGSYCFPGCFIIGDGGGLLHKRAIVRLP